MSAQTLQGFHYPTAMAIPTNIDFRHGRDSGCSLMILIRMFYIALIILHGGICNAQLPHLAHLCGAPYTNRSKFESNLKTVFKNLVQHTSQTGFSTSVYGQSPDQVFGLLQCRGDTTVDQCYHCSQLVTANIQQFCTSVGARVWFDFCYLRYETKGFFGHMEDAGGAINNVTANVINPSVSVAVLNKFLYNLSAEAASAMKRCAFNITVDFTFRKIYGQAECTRDISTDDCTKCLSETIKESSANYSGNQGLQVFKSSCIVRYDRNSFFNSDKIKCSVPPPSPPLAEKPTHTPLKQITPSSTHINNHSNKIPLILSGVGAILLVLSECLFATWRRLKFDCQGHGQVEEDPLISQDRQIVTFKMETLVAARDNFHYDNKLGEGGFGPVYKGTTEDGKEIAVKRLSLRSMQGRTEFLNEVKLVAKIRHRNIVNILGCCAEGSERLLVYEYLPNKSLDKFLRDPNKHLDWQKRYNIILGVARGLLYLHQDSHLRIVHRDIKASNILLDAKLNPQIADFGLARLFPEDETHVSTRAAGTYGYMAPEYALHQQLSVKVDVYSFGVVLLELVTGRRSTDYYLSSEMETLLEWVWKSYQRGNIVQMIDPTIIETCDEEQALRCIHVGLLCTQADSSLRPSMSMITLMLSPQFVGIPAPTKPGYVISATQNTRSANSGSGLPPAALAQVQSNADSSITNLVPR